MTKPYESRRQLLEGWDDHAQGNPHERRLEATVNMLADDLETALQSHPDKHNHALTMARDHMELFRHDR